MSEIVFSQLSHAEICELIKKGVDKSGRDAKCTIYAERVGVTILHKEYGYPCEIVCWWPRSHAELNCFVEFFVREFDMHESDS